MNKILTQLLSKTRERKDTKQIMQANSFTLKPTLMCPECFNYFELEIDGRVFVSLKDALTDESISPIDIDIETDQPTIIKIITKCKHCGKKVEFFEVDSCIAPTIKALNKKGYPTVFSCQGHCTNNAFSLPYIVFRLHPDSKKVKRILDTLPNKWEVKQFKSLLYKNEILTNINLKREYIKDIVNPKIMVELFDWAINLKEE